MATEIGVSAPLLGRAEARVPYPPSVVDRFIAWADRVPGPAWSLYLGMLAVLVVIVNGVTWLDGSVRFGTLDLYRTSIPVYPVSILALMHYLNRAACRALAEFRPALGGAEAEYARFEYELTTLPSGRTWVVCGASLVFTVAFAVFTPSLAEALRRSLWLAGVDFVLYAIVFGLVSVFVYHTLRQLRMVSLIHASARNVNLFQLTPLYAFSGLTARTGIGLLLLNSFSILTDPATLVNPPLFGLTIFTSLVSVACFFLPLKGIHDCIASKKQRLLAEVNARLEAAIQHLYRRADAQDPTGIEQVNQLLTALVTTREVLTKIPTWPWETGTLTGFISAFLLPFIVGLIILFLEQVLR
ncbi:MAG TPA: hypothetical protein VHS99_04760 [Chloroflexota bacterium]|nr:hypothetical protein [Chloroflexota bacterium]